ncbi:ROK family protein [Sporosarcina obsidiansis]|uniref:ROK family protein n=1 Tax=Sporosarcina obsidiansis TaxID=2660748 RepID=UPI001891C645|nr:ROK family protein [Sporosarcina obsidiansis]
MLYGSIELGGTNCNCAVGLQDGTIVKKVQFPTETPEITVRNVLNFFKENQVAAIGIGCFGPVNVDETSPDYGMLLDTPKKAWVNFPFLQQLREQLNVPIRLHTDVTVSGLGEMSASDKKETLLYITIGTGVGGGIILNGTLPNSSHHPEMGHVTLQRVEGDEMESACPFHANCFEGLASGTAIHKRWKQKGNELPSDHPAWEMEADYIAQGVCQFIFTLAPTQIIIGGGVMKQKNLLPMIHRKVQEKLGGYYFYDEIKDIEDFVILPRHGEDSALIGGLLLNAN